MPGSPAPLPLGTEVIRRLGPAPRLWMEFPNLELEAQTAKKSKEPTKASKGAKAVKPPKASKATHALASLEAEAIDECKSSGASAVERGKGERRTAKSNEPEPVAASPVRHSVFGSECSVSVCSNPANEPCLVSGVYHECRKGSVVRTGQAVLCAVYARLRARLFEHLLPLLSEYDFILKLEPARLGSHSNDSGCEVPSNPNEAAQLALQYAVQFGAERLCQ